jgi:hypothetical protein
MAMTDPYDDLDRRNAAPRMRLAAEAEFIGLWRRQRVMILDLSQTGAKVAFSEPPDEQAGFIRWMDFETFGDAVWREGLYIGLKFDRPIPQRWLSETLERSQPIDEYEHEALMRAAQEWVEG